MGTIIDELVVELKLDPKQFDQAQKDQVRKLREFEREHERHSKKLASDTGAVTQAFSLLQGRLLAIAGLFMGGMGITQFTEHITKLTVQTGLLAQSLGLSTSQITKWQGVGATVGAAPGEMAQAIASVRNAQSDLRNGRPSEMQKFAYMTHSNPGPAVDFTKDTDPDEFMIGVARWLEYHKKQGPQSYAAANRAVSTMLGFGQGTINTLDLGPDELRKRLKEMEKFAPTPDQIKRFKELQEAFGHLEQSTLALGRAFVDKLQPTILMIIKLLDKLANLLHPADDAKVKAFTDDKLPEMGGSRSIFGRIKRWWNGGDKDSSSAGAGAAVPGAANDNAGPAPGTGVGSSGAPGKVGRTGWWTPERKQHAVDYLMKNANLPEISARALVARWAGVEATGGPNEVNSIGAVGIGQWLGNRKIGVVRGDFDGQLAHAVRELKGPEGRAYRTLMGARDARAAATGASMYERAEGYNASTGMDNFTGKTMRFMSHIPGGSPDTMRRDGAAKDSSQRPGTFDALWNSRIGNLSGAGAALRTGGGTVNNNTRSNQTHIGNMHVTVPPGADPAGYGRGISQELQRYDTVMHANEGVL